jgi:hypothetical protein
VCTAVIITFVVSAVAIRLPSKWRAVPAAGATAKEATANPAARDEVVTSQPRSFKKAQLELEGKQVKGAPFSAELTIETPQFSRDGTSKPSVAHSLVYRDVNGRIRREQADEAAKINDFVAGLTYLLEPRLQIAHKRELESVSDTTVEPANTRSMSSRRYQVLPSGTTSSGSDSTTNTVSSTSPTVTRDSLGERMLEGINVEGTKLTSTIPANSFGNSEPIVIVEEQWYSPELRMMVLIKYSDPRFGDSFYRLTTVNRTEPSPALFVVPEKYVVKDELGKQTHRGN